MADGPQVVILAAGLGTRMRSSTPKVLHPLGGRSLIGHAIQAAEAVSGGPPIVVVNPAQPAVAEALDGRVVAVPQEAARGTGDALRSVPASHRSEGTVLVLSADVPLIRGDTLRRLLDAHEKSGGAATLLTATPDDPHGLGRVVRGADGRVQRVVEQRDIAPEDVLGGEVNAGVYAFDGARLWSALDRISATNAQGEYYLTDVVAMLAPDVDAVTLDDPHEAIGINDRRELARAESILRRRTLDALMLGGVTIDDPDTTYVDVTVRVAADSVIRPMTSLRGATVLGGGAEIGPSASLRDVRAGDRVVVAGAWLEECELGDDVVIGPYCRVRPNSILRSGVQLGTHAEVKNSTVGEGTRINHFACVLDSDVGRDVNIGAGAVTCNFDGSAKHRTVIDDGVFVGTNTTLVAPLHLGEGSYVAAGSVVSQDVPPGALAMGRSRQRNIEGWAARRGRS